MQGLAKGHLSERGGRGGDLHAHGHAAVRHPRHPAGPRRAREPLCERPLRRRRRAAVGGSRVRVATGRDVEVAGLEGGVLVEGAIDAEEGDSCVKKQGNSSVDKYEKCKVLTAMEESWRLEHKCFLYYFEMSKIRFNKRWGVAYH